MHSLAILFFFIIVLGTSCGSIILVPLGLLQKHPELDGMVQKKWEEETAEAEAAVPQLTKTQEAEISEIEAAVTETSAAEVPFDE